MLFTPGRIVGLALLVAVVLAVGFLLKRLEAMPRAVPSDSEGVADSAGSHARDDEARQPDSQSRPPQTRRRRRR